MVFMKPRRYFSVCLFIKCVMTMKSYTHEEAMR